MQTPDGLPVLFFADAPAFALWLEAPTSPAGAWLKFVKAGRAGLSKAQAIDCALCFGWIDGQLRGLDDAFFLTRFTPRKRGSRWSARNVERAEALIAEGRMRRGGLAEIEAAKADGRWTAAYPSAAQMTTPDDFEAALRREPHAAAFFAALDGANRYAVLYRLHHARSREARIAELVAMLARGESFHPPRKVRRHSDGKAPRRGGEGGASAD